MPRQNARPGDLGRRITYHREKLGLAREQVAERAGMAPGFLEYLEQRPSSLTQGVLLRLAAALETTADELLGGTTDRPPGGGAAAAYPVLRALEPHECLRLVAPGGVGRVAFTGPTGPVVLPVNYTVHHDTVVFRTRVGGSIGEGVLESVTTMIGFEVDHIDEARREGWSVLIQGPAGPVAPDELPIPGLEPWPGGDRGLHIRIVPHHITGRRIHGF
ncbi:pyridoxamine 5'-phosphate oxidase family protein [Microbispora bryophytorum]|uniref:pyridoxamine 5'-phosphate oxidase family protein n=1 Tax=Microbispora bryophytorum TaxID=1460882 RepID=UPI0033EC2DAB